jgi:hypothetical protein
MVKFSTKFSLQVSINVVCIMFSEHFVDQSELSLTDRPTDCYFITVGVLL